MKVSTAQIKNKKYMMFYNTFSNNPNTSTLIISDKFVYGATNTSAGSTQYTKAKLVENTKFNTNVKLICNGKEITE